MGEGGPQVPPRLVRAGAGGSRARDTVKGKGQTQRVPTDKSSGVWRKQEEGRCACEVCEPWVVWSLQG